MAEENKLNYLSDIFSQLDFSNKPRTVFNFNTGQYEPVASDFVGGAPIATGDSYTTSLQSYNPINPNLGLPPEITSGQGYSPLGVGGDKSTPINYTPWMLGIQAASTLGSLAAFRSEGRRKQERFNKSYDLALTNLFNQATLLNQQRPETIASRLEAQGKSGRIKEQLAALTPLKTTVG